MSRHQPTWLVKDAYRNTLSPAVLNRLITGEGVRHTLLKRELPSRTVALLNPESPELPALYLKEYRFPHVTSRLKHLFHSPADREWKTSFRIAAQGIPTFEPLAVGTLRRFGLPAASYLISREIDNARSLKDCLLDRQSLDAQTSRVAGKTIICSLARFVRDLHRKGILHRDFHWGNILIDARDLNNIRWYLMDLHRVRLMSRLNDRDRVNNLAALGTAFRFTARGEERFRFLAQYARGDARWENRLQHFARRIESRSDRLLKRIWAGKARRCLKSNQYFTPFRFPACRGFLRGEISSPPLLELLQDPGRAFSDPACSIVKNSHTTSSCTLPLIMAGKPASIFIKRYNYQNSLYALKNLFRRSRGKRTWKTAHALLAREIPTPLPVAFAEKRWMRVLRESFCITQNIAQAVPLSRLFPEAGSPINPGHTVDKNNLIREAALLVQMMHERGIWHRDLKAANILVQRTPGGGTTLYLTDLDGIRIRDTVGTGERMRDLSRLNRSLLSIPALSTRDRLRFMRCYLNTGSRRDKTLRAYWEGIGRETAKQLAKVVKNL